MNCRNYLCALAFLLLLHAPATTFSQDQSPVPFWIWPQAKMGEHDVVYFRKTFSVPGDLKRALLVVSADNEAQVLVNGDKRGFKSDNWERPIIEDITDRLNAGGDNVIAVRAGNKGGSAGFLAQIVLENRGGVKTAIVSDDSWEASNQGEKGWNDVNFSPKGGPWKPAVKLNAAGTPPREKISPAFLATLENLREPTATQVDHIKLAEGFRVELLYSVPKTDQGSWVAMTQDDKGRLIVSDQYGSLYRLTPPALGQTLSEGDVEKIDLDIGGAQGLLYAFDSLYAVLNTNEHGGRGLYRVRDTDGDDKFDSKELLRKFEEQGGEHGPHAVVLGPDGKSIYVIIGDQTPVTEVDQSRVPKVWDEDLLLERPYGRGFMKGVMAPGGWIAKTDPDGKTWELIATGFRNEYDAAFNREGQLFTYDADMEWDMNTPWYRPTRVCLVASGAEFGWRNGGGKWPAYYPDSLPAVVDIGPGSPTGVSFGYGAKFPKKYQDALFICDWSYGKLYAVHLDPKGAGYAGKFEEFMSAQPLPLTDILVGNQDGAMYITIGGRRVQSGLYRVTYVGDESIGDDQGTPLSDMAEERLKLESFHGKQDPKAIETAWPFLSSEDRWLRFAARIAIESQPVSEWQEKALSEKNPVAAINAAIALARHGEKALQPKLLTLLNVIDWSKLTASQQTDLTRAYSLAFTRMGMPDDATREKLIAHLDPHLPAKKPEPNIELVQLLVYLQAPSVAGKGIALLKSAPSQEEQIAYAKSLRHLKAGWTHDLRADYFRWFVQAAGYKGGASFGLFVENMKQTALENTPEEEKIALKEIIEAKPEGTEPRFTFEPREFVKNWTLSDFDDVINVGLEGNRDYTNGRKMFGAATCFACHRFNQEGGAIGPDLTSVSGKFSPHDLLEQIIDPNKEISDQYGSMVFTMIDGTQINGRVMNLNGDSINVNTNMLNPDQIETIDRKRLKEMKASPYSMMPIGLLNTLSKDDVLDLMAYLLSGGDPENPMFK
ncbi:MAG: c-type cytochrome [Verrucomicrobiae bacterium]|nr:c-type cytochrome [Verrucomicrobiae bacterium]